MIYNQNQTQNPEPTGYMTELFNPGTQTQGTSQGRPIHVEGTPLLVTYGAGERS